MLTRILLALLMAAVAMNMSFAQLIEVEERTKGWTKSMYNYNNNTGRYEKSGLSESRSINKYYYRIGNEGEFQRLKYGNELKALLKTNNKAYRQLKLFKTKTIIESTAALLAITTVIIIPSSAKKSKNERWMSPLGWAVSGVAIGVLSRGLHLTKGKHVIKAVEIYNDDLIEQEKKNDLGIKLNLKLDTFDDYIVPGIGISLHIGGL